MTPMPLSRLIEQIENELCHAYIGGAIRYIDDAFDGAWSNAIDRFDRALSSADHQRIEFEAELYRANILKFIEVYKKYRANRKVEEFLATIA